jgi:hypothetical protein
LERFTGGKPVFGLVPKKLKPSSFGGDFFMLRTFVVALFGLVILAGGLSADEVKGKIKSVDGDKVVVTVGDKDQEFNIADATVLNAAGKAVKDKSKALTAGKQVTLKTEKKAGKDVVTEVKIGGGKKQDK